MKHSEETIKASEEYSNDFSTRNGFIAGVEHAQKDIQELVDALGYSNMVIKAWNDCHSQIEKNNKLIQKHRR